MINFSSANASRSRSPLLHTSSNKGVHAKAALSYKLNSIGESADSYGNPI
jgi:hypothetical protein